MVAAFPHAKLCGCVPDGQESAERGIIWDSRRDTYCPACTAEGRKPPEPVPEPPPPAPAPPPAPPPAKMRRARKPPPPDDDPDYDDSTEWAIFFALIMVTIAVAFIAGTIGIILF